MIAIFGPTSSGKTSLATSLCQKFDGEIVSADSRQVYRYMDIGTNKGPVKLVKKGFRSYWSLADVPIWGINLVDPDHRFSAADYVDYALAKVDDIFQRGKVPFLVGGTGFYLDAVLGKVKLAGVPSHPEFRQECDRLPKSVLLERLRKLNPGKAEKIDPNNKRRLIRALEIEIFGNLEDAGTVHVPSRVFAPGHVDLQIGLTAPRECLYQRADLWAEAIFEQGVMHELDELISRGYRNSRPMKSVIYKTLVELHDQKLSLQEAIQQIKFDLHAYIRRQLTWFKRCGEAVWFDASRQGFDKEIEERVRLYLRER